jgi:hypothetical protein
MKLGTSWLCFVLLLTMESTPAPQTVLASPVRRDRAPSRQHDVFPYALACYRVRAFQQIALPAVTHTFLDAVCFHPSSVGEARGPGDVDTVLLANRDPLYGLMSLQL